MKSTLLVRELVVLVTVVVAIAAMVTGDSVPGQALDITGSSKTNKLDFLSMSKEKTSLDGENSSIERGSCGVMPSCIRAGGDCVRNVAKCDGACDKKTCRGHNCQCCIPGDCFPTISCTMAGGHCVKGNEYCHGTLDHWACTGRHHCKCCLPYPDNVGSMQVTYSLKIFQNETITLELDVDQQISFFDVMQIAQSKSYEFRFNYTWYNTEHVAGAYITSIGGLSQVIHNGSGFVWNFYSCNKNANTSLYPEGCNMSEKGVSITFPTDGSFWLLDYQFVNWSK